MRVKALKEFTSSNYGNVSEGQYLTDVPDQLAKKWIGMGMVEEHKKVLSEVPTDAGGDKEPSSSPAAPVSPPKTAKKSKKKKLSRSTVR